MLEGVGQRLVESEYRYRVFVENAPFGIIVINSEHIVLQWNNMAEKLFGYTMYETIGKPIYEYVVPTGFVDTFKKEVQQFLNTGKTFIFKRNQEIEAKNKNGEIFLINLTIAPFQIREEWYFLGYIADITAQKRAEQRLQLKERELLESKHLEEKKNEFLSIASHELKTPLTVIKGFAQLAIAQLSKGSIEDVKGYLSRVEAQSSKIHLLIQQLLDVSKIENGRLEYSFQEIDVKQYLYQIVESFQHLVPNPIKLHINYNAFVKIDALRMEQVLSNLISNASKYSDKETPIEITTIIIKDTISIAVTDYGIGISEENLERIFQRFFRVNQNNINASGLGMGLYIAAKIIKDHGGDIWAHSIFGTGSTFHFTLPISKKS